MEKMTFEELGLINPILKAISEAGYSSPTNIQQKAIPHILNGDDLIGCAQTGTGKTAAFAIPILQNMHLKEPGGRNIKTLILTPTRELAIQIDENFKVYGKHLKLKTLCIFGGVSQVSQVSSLKNGVDILIATPGRLLDLFQQKLLNLSKVETLVLDEADRMLDMGFIHDVKRILTHLKSKKQTLFFSATMPETARKFANSILVNPKEINVTPVSSTAKTVKQTVYFVDKALKTNLLVEILEDQSITRTLVFTRTKHGADRLVKQLGKSGIIAMAIHGNKSQNARQRALEAFKSSKVRVLIATDIAARGIDIDELPHVVNYEIPNIPETYVHRIGRTGRAGLNGEAISFCDKEEESSFRSIQRLTGAKITIKESLN